MSAAERLGQRIFAQQPGTPAVGVRLLCHNTIVFSRSPSDFGRRPAQKPLRPSILRVARREIHEKSQRDAMRLILSDTSHESLFASKRKGSVRSLVLFFTAPYTYRAESTPCRGRAERKKSFRLAMLRFLLLNSVFFRHV